MPLVSLSSIESSLVCPSCKNPITPNVDGYSCADASCEHARYSAFTFAEARPVLVDFQRSILSREDVFKPLLPKTRQSARWLRSLAIRAISGRKINVVARNNVDRFIDALPPRRRVLIVGGAARGNGAEGLYTDPRVSIVAFDIVQSPLIQFIADAHDIPLADGSVDGVWIQAVLEHVLDPWRVVAEIHRVLAPGGIVYADTPFMQPVHAGPWDFTRFTESGHRWLFRSFERINSGVVAGPGDVFVTAVDFSIRALSRSNVLGRACRRLFQMAGQLIDGFSSTPHALDCASAVFFLGSRSETALKPREMIAQYRGAQHGNIRKRRARS